MVDNNKTMTGSALEEEELSKFTESYASFNRIINSLQRKYIELKDEFTVQNEKLVEANKKLVDLTRRNLTATEFLKSILSSISVGVIAIDQNCRITNFNPAASIILGVSQPEAIGKEYREIVPPGDPVNANVLRTSETGCEVDSVEKKIELKNGTCLNLSVSTAVLRDNEGKSIGAVEVLHDLTKMKKMEKEIVRLNTLATLGEMAATIAHEVRNPLSGISGFAALLERDLDDDDPKRELIRKIIAGVDSLNETVATLLSYTRFDEIKKRNTSYCQFIDGVIEQFKIDNVEKAIDTNIVFKKPEIIGESNLEVMLDPMLFRQILFNMFNNAVEAFKGRGEIVIECRKIPRQKAIVDYSEKVLLSLDETILETTITDNGSGISKEDRENIFAPFFTTKQGGNGLGLAVAVKIIKAHGGEIIVSSPPEGGSVFQILLPMKD